jgi:hypothetical protein
MEGNIVPAGFQYVSKSGGGKRGSSTSGVISFATEKRLDEGMYKLARHIHETNEWARIARGTVVNAVTREEPIFSRGARRLEGSELFRELVRLHWLPFVRDFMDEWWCRGVVPIRVRRLPNGDRVPVVVRGPGYHYTTFYDMEADIQRYRAYRNVDRTTQQPITPVLDEEVIIIAGLGSDPTQEGRLTSAVASFAYEESFLKLLHMCAVSSEVKRSNPPLVTETNDKSEGAVTKEATSSYYGGSDNIVKRAEDMFIKDRLETEEVIRQNREFQQKWAAIHAAEHADDNNPLGDLFKKQHDGNVYPLPLNHKLVTYSLPDPRHDLLDLKRLAQETLCIIYGISRSTLTGENNRTATGADVTQKVFYNTLSDWRIRLSRVLTDVYDLIYSEGDYSYFLSQQQESNESGKRKRSDDSSSSLPPLLFLGEGEEDVYGTNGQVNLAKRIDAGSRFADESDSEGAESSSSSGRRRDDHKTIGAEDPSEKGEIEKVSVTLPVFPAVQLEQLIQLYSLGVVPWPTSRN